MMEVNKIICGDALSELKKLPADSIDCAITSPPYWGLRDYGVSGQLGLEKTPEEYVAKLIEIFKEVKRCLKKEGTFWLNLGDSYVSAKGRYSSNKQTIAGHGRNEPMDGKRPDQKNHAYLKDKDLCGIPWQVAFALQQDGWYLRQDIIWHKPNPMPESVTDRCTKSHEYVFLLTKNSKYHFDQEAIFEPANYDGRKDTLMKGSKKYENGYMPNQLPQTMASRGHERWRWKEMATYTDNRFNKGRIEYQNRLTKCAVKVTAFRNRRSVWTINTKPFKEAHFATFPEALIEPMVLAGCPKRGIILDPFMGSGTTALVARNLGRNYLGIELNPEYIKIAEKRLAQEILL